MTKLWTPENLSIAERILLHSNDYHSAIEQIQEELGFEITRHALQKAFQRNCLAAPTAILGANVSNTIPAPAPSAARTPCTSTPPPDDSPVAKLIRAAKKGVSFEDLANKLDLSPAKLRGLVEEAKKAGFRVDVVHDTVAWKPINEFDDEQVIPMPATAGDYLYFAVASDLHIGSKHFMQKQLEDFVDLAYAAGCRNGLIPGDMLDGNMRFLMWEQSHRGLQEQAELAAKVLPRRPGWRWDFIIGNHEESFELMSGIDSGQAIVNIFKDAGRNDLHYHGPRSAYVRLVSPGAHRGLLIELHHPKGAPAYAVSYKAQRHIDNYPIGAKGGRIDPRALSPSWVLYPSWGPCTPSRHVSKWTFSVSKVFGWFAQYRWVDCEVRIDPRGYRAEVCA